jgi:hypothetical protein
VATNALERAREDVYTRRHVRAPEETKKSTLGDLVEALTEETKCYVHDEREVYKIVSYMVTDLLSRRRCLSRSCN